MRAIILISLIAFTLSSTCHDGSSCAGAATCCELASGSYGCCPYSDATCCSDKQHCCPNGYECDVSSSMCQRKNDFLGYVSVYASLNAADVPVEKKSEVEYNPIALMKCIQDLVRDAPEIKELIADIQKQDIADMIRIVSQLMTDTALIEDCKNAFSS